MGIRSKVKKENNRQHADHIDCRARKRQTRPCYDKQNASFFCGFDVFHQTAKNILFD